MARARKTIRVKRDLQGSLLRFASVGGFTMGSILAAMQADAAGRFGPDTAVYVYPVALILGPIVGFFVGDLLEKAAMKMFAGAFGRDGGRVGPQHGIGETLLQQGDRAGAADWFADRYRSDPKDWRAQARLVEILAEHFPDDPDRLAGEKNRLLKAEGVPDGLWCRIAHGVAAWRDETGRQKEATIIRQMLVERCPDTWQGEEARERLRVLQGRGDPPAPPTA